jgi:hypothetical protein
LAAGDFCAPVFWVLMLPAVARSCASATQASAQIKTIEEIAKRVRIRFSKGLRFIE